MFSAAKETASTAQARGEEANEYATGGAGLCSEIVDFVIQPVAGKSIFQIIYYLLAIVLVAFFAWTVVGVIPTWSEPVTSISTTFYDEMDFPDVYVCIPANQMAPLVGLGGNPPERDVKFQGGLPNDNKCTRNMAHVAPDNYSPIEGSEVSCIGSVATSIEDSTAANAMVADGNGFPADEMAKKLASLMPVAIENGEEVQASCFKFNMAGTKANFESRTIVRWEWSYTPVEQEFTPYFEVYVSEPGASPTLEREGKTFINASQILAPGFGDFSMLELAVDEYMDETKGEEDYHKEYRASVTSKANALQGPIAATSGGIGVRFSTHVVRQIHIRDRKPEEIISELGGLWAGATAIMSLFFVGSGYLNKNGKKLAIFRWLTSAQRQKALEGLTQDMTVEEQHEQHITELRRRVLDLERTIQGLQATAAAKPVPAQIAVDVQ